MSRDKTYSGCLLGILIVAFILLAYSGLSWLTVWFLAQFGVKITFLVAFVGWFLFGAIVSMFRSPIVEEKE